MGANNYPLAPQPPDVFTYLGQQVAGGPILGGVLIGDYVNNSATVPAGSAYNTPSVTLLSTVPVSAQLELQSTTGALLVMRMTTTQRNALVTVVNGMMIYNITTSTFQFYQGGAWLSLTAGAGGGNVIGPLSSTATAVALFADTTGQLLENSLVLIDGSGNITGANTIANGDGSAAAPSYTFTSRTNTGMYSSAANTLDFATDGTRQLSVGGAITAVNYLQLQGSVATAPVLINALGTDTNISIQLVPKGTGQVVHPVGAVGTPGIAFAGDLTTGLYDFGTHEIGVATNGLLTFAFTTTASTVDYLSVTGSATNAGNAALQPGFAANGSDTNIDISITGKGTGGLAILPTASTAGNVKLWNAGGTFYTELLGGNVGSNLTLTLPTVAPLYSNAPLVSSTAGVLSFNNAGVINVGGTLTSANLIAMYTTPISLLGAPASGTAYVIHKFEFEYLFVSTPYATDAGSIFLTYGSSAHAAANLATGGVVLTGLTDQGASTVSTADGVVTGVASASMAATAVFISNTSAALATGDGTARYNIWFSVVAV